MNMTWQSAVLEWITPNAEYLIESAARTVYKSIARGSTADFIRMLIRRGHLSPLEHASASFRLVTDRGISHELVRHRLASYAQESTRYCKYYGGIRVIAPPISDSAALGEWSAAVERAQTAYTRMIESGVPPQFARAVLPTCTATELVMTANFREWRHIIALRTAKDAHPQIRELIGMVNDQLQEKAPAVFGDSTCEA